VSPTLERERATDHRPTRGVCRGFAALRRAGLGGSAKRYAARGPSRTGSVFSWLMNADSTTVGSPSSAMFG